MNEKQREAAFQQIAEDVISAAEKVDCTLEQFEGGLVEIRDALQERLDLVRDELREKSGSDDALDDEEDEE